MKKEGRGFILTLGYQTWREMDDLPKLYFTMETYLFPLLEEKLGELTAK